ncbi:MAG: insulinase family protein, partial [Aquirufa sp.]
MISFEEFTLANGLKVIVHEDPDTSMAVVDVIYNVGSRDEDENLTGFAHLFEHLMFGVKPRRFFEERCGRMRMHGAKHCRRGRAHSQALA